MFVDSFVLRQLLFGVKCSFMSELGDLVRSWINVTLQNFREIWFSYLYDEMDYGRDLTSVDINTIATHSEIILFINFLPRGPNYI